MTSERAVPLNHLRTARLGTEWVATDRADPSVAPWGS
jgi:hypothetical protein